MRPISVPPPTAVLWLPVVRFCSVSAPRDVFQLPVVLLESAVEPLAVFADDYVMQICYAMRCIA